MVMPKISLHNQFKGIRFKRILILLSPVFVLYSLFIATLLHPYPAFPFKTDRHNIELYSDTPLPVETAPILDAVVTRLKKSPYYEANTTYKIFLAKDDRKFSYFTLSNNSTAGQSYVYLNQNIFMRSADFEKNQIIIGGEYVDPAERSYTYFLTHELVHSMMVQETGRLEYALLPEWIKEGYAEYIARDSYNLTEELSVLRQVESGADRTMQGLYTQYHLYLAYSLDYSQNSLESLTSRRVTQESVRQAILNDERLAKN
jgi:hypothetical protein